MLQTIGSLESKAWLVGVLPMVLYTHAWSYDSFCSFVVVFKQSPRYIPFLWPLLLHGWPMSQLFLYPQNRIAHLNGEFCHLGTTVVPISSPLVLTTNGAGRINFMTVHWCDKQLSLYLTWSTLIWIDKHNISTHGMVERTHPYPLVHSYLMALHMQVFIFHTRVQENTWITTPKSTSVRGTT